MSQRGTCPQSRHTTHHTAAVFLQLLYIVLCITYVTCEMCTTGCPTLYFPRLYPCSRGFTPSRPLRGTWPGYRNWTQAPPPPPPLCSFTKHQASHPPQANANPDPSRTQPRRPTPLAHAHNGWRPARAQRPTLSPSVCRHQPEPPLRAQTPRPTHARA